MKTNSEQTMPTPQHSMSWRRSVKIFLGPVRELLGRRLTARWRALPNVYIVGAVKAGTTSMAAYLEQHPAYVPAFTKELIYLQDLPNFSGNEVIHPVFKYVWGNYRKNHAVAYRKFFPWQSQMRAARKNTGSTAYTGDHTPFYLYCPKATRRIRNLCPQAKIIVLLRNPVERAFADFNMHQARNPQEQRSFSQAVRDELERINTGDQSFDFRMRYLEKSNYATHVRRYQETFPSERLKILRSEDFFDPERTEEMMQDIFRFLGIEPSPLQNLTVHNKGTYDTSLDDTTRQCLAEHFHPRNQRLRQLLGEDFRWDD